MKYNGHNKTSPLGFTLIELLVVLVVIAVLVAISLSVLSKTRNQALIVSCSQNLKSIGVALALFSGDHAGMYPPTFIQTTPDYSVTWPVALNSGGYIADTRTFRCPGDTINPAANALSYTYCPIMSGPTGDVTKSLRPANLTYPAQQYLLTEWHDPSKTWDGGSGLIAAWDLGPGTVSATHPNGSRNFLFGDGHVALRTQAEVNDPQSGWRLNDFDGK